MEKKIQTFFEGPGKKATDILGFDANVIFTFGENSYALKKTENGEAIVGKTENEKGDIEIRGEKSVMDDLISSSSLHEFLEKHQSYMKVRREPKIIIHMERTHESNKKYLRVYTRYLWQLGLQRT